MQVEEEARDRKDPRARGAQCNQISSSIAWKNRKFTFSVCATSAAKAANKVTDAEITRVVKAQADAAIQIDCTSGESCGDPQRCLPGDIVCNINVTIRPAGANCRQVAGGSCTAPETAWECDIWADVDAAKRCGCRVP